MEVATVFVPGSVSNLGPGFDCLGAAFTGKGDRVTAERSPEAGVRVRRVSDPRLPTDPTRNTAAIAAAAVLRRAGASCGLELTIEKGLPLAGGMGGSAASAVGGAVAADAVLGSKLPREALLEAALDAEAVVAGRHADNVAPSLYGGAVLVLGIDPARVVPVRVHESLALSLATPGYGVATAEARAVLPREIPRADAIAQAAHLGALLLALERGDGSVIAGAMVDRIAEPARRFLYPGAAEAREAALAAGAHAVTVSGAGPTLVAITPAGSADAVAAALVAGYRRAGIDAVGHAARVDEAGARVLA